jgi:hypothetical protein
MASSRGPRLMGNGSEILNEVDTARVRKVIARMGITKAPLRLGISMHVIEQARDFGRISRPVMVRLMVAVGREEAAHR